MSIIGCFYEHTHTHNKGLGREYMGHAKKGPPSNRSEFFAMRCTLSTITGYISKVTGYTQKCDSIDFTTKAGRAGQTSGSGLGRRGRFGHQPYSSPFHSAKLDILGDSPVMKTFPRTLDQIAMTHTIDTVIDREI